MKSIYNGMDLAGLRTGRARFSALLSQPGHRQKCVRAYHRRQLLESTVRALSKKQDRSLRSGLILKKD